MSFVILLAQIKCHDHVGYDGGPSTEPWMMLAEIQAMVYYGVVEFVCIIPKIPNLIHTTATFVR